MHLLVRYLAVAIATSGLSTAAIAGGATLGDDEIQNLPSYFGFAKDANGTFLANVKVTMKLKGIAVVARTDVLGAYKIPVIGTQPEGAELTCSKDGYRQTGAVRRTPPGVDTKTPVEIDCTLERE